MTSKNYRASILYYIKHCASFQSHRWIQTGVTVWKHSIRVNIADFLSCVILKFDRWHWKTVGHLFCATSSIVHHFIAICEFKLELQSGNAQFGSKSTSFEPCNLEIWQMTLKNNRASLLCYLKLCASFHRHLWIQTGFTSPIRVKIADYLGCVILKFDRWPGKTIGSASGSRDFTRFGPGGSTLSRFPCKTPIGKVGTSQYTVVTRKLA